MWFQRLTEWNHLNSYYCIKSVLQAFNDHVSTRIAVCINKANHMLLMHEFGTFITFLPGDYSLSIYHSYMAWLWNTNINEDICPPVD